MRAVLARSLVPAAIVLVTLVTGSAVAADYVDDPLTASSFAGRGSAGGAFSSSGWTTTGDTDTVWYEIADALETGHVEYEVTGMTVGGSLVGADHDLLCIYQATTGSTEPSVYAPDFRNNDFKFFQRVFGSAEPGRGGATKIELHLCPRGEPWHHDTACPESCYTGGLAYAGGGPTDIGWEGTRWYRISADWGSGKATLSRDGAVLATIGYTGKYAPQPLRVRIGSPRHKVGSTESMPKGLTFRNLKIAGVAGTMTPVCGAPVVPDAGPVDTGVAVDAGTGAIHEELAVLQDVTADKNVTGVSPDVNDLAVGADTAGPDEVVFLRFPKAAGAPKKAILRLTTTSSASATGGSGAIHAVSDVTWSETTLTWATKPSWDATAVGPQRTVDPDQVVEWDVTSIVSKGVFGFAVVSTDTNGSHYLSKEASTTKGPRLIVDSDPIVPSDAGVDAAPPDAADASAQDAGSDATIGPPGSDREAGDSGLEGDCGCRAAGRTPPGGPGGVLLVLAALVRRRRARGGDTLAS